ncbi:MAG: hypothetical protein WA777_00725 [Rhodanobacter sp.]
MSIMQRDRGYRSKRLIALIKRLQVTAITVGMIPLAVISMVRGWLHTLQTSPSKRGTVDYVMKKVSSNFLWVFPFLLFLIGITLLEQQAGLSFMMFPLLIVIGFEIFAYALVVPWVIRALAPTFGQRPECRCKHHHRQPAWSGWSVLRASR